MRFGILGPLLVCDRDTPVEVPAARQRVLLAALLVRAGQPVPASALAELVWDGAPPAGAAVTLRSHVMRLRRALGPGPGSRVLTRPPGYLIQAGEDELDLLRFGCRCQEGGAALRAGAWEQASAALGEALGLWRGDPLADVPCGLLHQQEVPALEQMRLQALEWRIDAGLHLGRHAELAPELQRLAARHPLRERFHAQLMLALYRCGRQAEALAVYQQTRRVLLDELGTEPGAGLRELHQRILTADPALAVPQPARPAAAAAAMPREPPARGAAVAPRELSAGVRHFTGRAAELAVLTGLLGRPGERAAGTVVISAICGMAGVGKTALAVHWAHQVASRFPDGQLHVNLRGYDPGPPVPAADALAGFLRALGVPGQAIPPGLDERAARYRSLLDGRRMLVVLDNARSAEQVRPLLPGSPGCVAVVTSRDSLAGLVARDGAARLEVDMLPPAEAVGLLRALIGSRVDADPAAAAALAGRCGRLPLALRVAAEIAVSRPAVSLARLAGELAGQQRRLDLLDAAGDPRTAVRAVFSWSYHWLDPVTARAFRLAGLHPGHDLDRHAAAALTATTAEQAARLLDRLARASLMQPAGAGRHGMHDLLRAYATEQAAAADSARERRMAMTRLFDYYLSTAAAAMDTLFPAESHSRPRVAPVASPAPRLTNPAAARGWLDAELANLAAITAHAARHGWPGHATRLSTTLFRYLSASARYAEAVTIHTHARRAASRSGDRCAEAEALTSLGWAYQRQGLGQQAVAHHQQALDLFRATGDRAGQARTLDDLGCADILQGRHRQAAIRFRQALTLSRAAGDRAGEARALGNLGLVDVLLGRHAQATGHIADALVLCREIGNRIGEAQAFVNLGIVDLRQGRYQQAAEHYQQALALFRESGERPGEASALGGVGLAELRQGRSQQAAEHYRRALTLFRESGDRSGEAYTLTNLGVADARQGRYQQAARHHRQALALFREIGDPPGEAEALNGLGEVLLATGRPDQARARHTAALSLASQADEQDQQARAQHGLARACQAAGEPGLARRHWRQALTLYARLGAPEADEIRHQLAAPRADHRRQAQLVPPRR